MHSLAHTLIYSLSCTRTYNSHLNGKKLISQNLMILLLPKANNLHVSVPPPSSSCVSRSGSHSLLISPISFCPSCYIAMVHTVFVRGCVYLCVFVFVGLPTFQTNNTQLIHENAKHQPVAGYWFREWYAINKNSLKQEKKCKTKTECTREKQYRESSKWRKIELDRKEKQTQRARLRAETKGSGLSSK